MPRMPRILPWGSWPKSMPFLKLPALSDDNDGFSCRRAPSSSQRARSAVASVTGSGAYVRVIPRLAQAWVSIWS